VELVAVVWVSAVCAWVCVLMVVLEVVGRAVVAAGNDAASAGTPSRYCYYYYCY
jgi:hypothetical protein